MSERNLKKMTPDGVFAPVAKEAKKKKDKAASALEKNLDRAERKLQGGSSVADVQHHNPHVK